jgi:hypothetical protein
MQRERPAADGVSAAKKNHEDRQQRVIGPTHGGSIQDFSVLKTERLNHEVAQQAPTFEVYSPLFFHRILIGAVAFEFVA